MKKMILLMTALACICCAKDDDKVDDEKPQVEQPDKKLYVETMEVEIGDEIITMAFEYNGQKQLEKIESNQDNYDLEIIYEGNKPIQMISPARSIKITYEGAVIKHLDINEDITDVDYDEALKEYSFSGLSKACRLNSLGDITRETYVFVGEQLTFAFMYDAEKKGPMHNMQGEYLFMIPVILNINPFLSTRAATAFNEFEIVNTYNSDGYVTKGEYNNGEQAVINYTYKEL